MSRGTDPQAGNGYQSQSRRGPGSRSPNYVVVVVEDSEPLVEGAFLSEKSQRMSFVRKVLGTVALQLAFVTVVTAGFVFNESSSIKNFIRSYFWIYFIALIAWMVINISVTCCGVGRGPPGFGNISLLVLGTLCLTVVCVFVTVWYDRETIIYALAATVGVLVLVILVTVLTPLDITGWGIYLCVASFVVFFAVIIITLVLTLSSANRHEARLIFLILSFVVVLLLSFYILYDLQLIVGGEKRRYQLEKDDWLFACLILFGDIVFLFIMLLQLCGLIQGGSRD